MTPTILFFYISADDAGNSSKKPKLESGTSELCDLSNDYKIRKVISSPAAVLSGDKKDQKDAQMYTLCTINYKHNVYLTVHYKSTRLYL